MAIDSLTCYIATMRNDISEMIPHFRDNIIVVFYFICFQESKYHFFALYFYHVNMKVPVDYMGNCRNKKPCLLLVNKNLSFDSSFKGDFNLHDSVISRDVSNEFIFTGLQIMKNNKKL